MAEYAVCKVSKNGVGHSVVELNDVRHVLATARPRCGHTFRQQAEDALGVVEAVAEEVGGRGAIVHQAVFLADIDRRDECRRILRDFYGNDLPATSYIPQPPCEGKSLAIECLGVSRAMGNVEIDRVSEQLVIVRHNRIAWAHCAQVVPKSASQGVYPDVSNALERVRELLDGVSIGFDHAIRTWYYCGEIGGHDGGAPRYQELNRARQDFYRTVPFFDRHRPEGRTGPLYPASTGIGLQGRGVILSAIALATDRQDIAVVPLENPRQTPAYGYASGQSRVRPEFSRAVALSCGDYATIFISGTASITGEETRHPGDAVAQAHETLDNIAALISEENLAHHGLPGLGTSLASLGMARVYLKRPDDFAGVRAVCEARLGELPLIYALADVCRQELLVEIEGIAFARHAPSV